MIKEKVTIIGLGYVGFPLALAINKNSDYEVVGLDTDPKKIEKIKDFQVSTDERIIKDSKYIIIC